MSGPGLIPPERLTAALQARETTACGGCTTTPCCSNVPLGKFRMKSRDDLDHARFLLNFEHIELGLTASFRHGEEEWSIRFRQPCRFVDHGLCGVHGSAEQPDVCKAYAGELCWYRRVMGADAPVVNGEFLRVDRRRLELFAGALELDARGAIVAAPDWQTTADLFVDAPLEEPDFEAAAARPRLPVLPAAGGDGRGECAGCAAHCCTTLIFPHAQPSARRGLDFVRFLLGFPGVRIGISDAEWVLLVDTRCRHLEPDGRCGVFGQPERPEVCVRQPAAGCSYVARLGTPAPPDFLAAGLHDYVRLAAVIPLDERRELPSMPPLEVLRAAARGG